MVVVNSGLVRVRCLSWCDLVALRSLLVVVAKVTWGN